MPRNSVVRVKSRKKSIHCCLNTCCKAGFPVSSLPSSSIEPSSMAKSPPPPPPPSKPSSLDSTKPSSSSCSSSSHPNSSVSSCSQQALQDILYEYVKGLQDAIKVPDPELAERLLVEIGSALSLPSAVSLVISANGARLIASCVKHFRWNGLSKPLKAGKFSFPSPTTTTTTTNSPKGDEPEPEPGGGFMEDVLDPTIMDEALLSAAIPAESRRKRQRTVGELEEEEDMQSTYENRWGEPRKPVKLKGRSLKLGNSRKVGNEVVEAGNSSVEDKRSDTILEKGKCWATECPLTMDPSVVGDLEGKDFEVKSLMDKPEDSEESSASMAEDEGDGVYSLAKSSGMSNVVATACSALDKLLNAALQAKKSKAGNSGNGKRGKSLSAEMYVALTEAFVDMVHVLKDNVDLLSWCLNCLGSILPPGSLERASFEGSSSFNNVAPLKEPAMSDEDGSKGENSDGYSKQYQPHPAETLLDSKLFPSKALLKLAAKYRDHSASTDFTLKIGSKSTSGSYVAAARSFTSGKGGKGALQSSFYGGITSESTSSSISALAAVAYAATVPMLAEKAVKAVLSAMQSCDIEAHSTLAALRALGAHLSSTNSKSVCDDAFMFIIAAMREFVDNAEMQVESCLALGSLIRAVSSTTGHAAWSAITTSMEHHGTNLAVQRAGCAALQILCTRTGLGIPEWRTGKRPLRASKDSDREAGARALIASMSAFSNDIRIQWHGCSTLWTLVHSAGVKSVGNMVKAGAVTAVVGAMSVCRMNEMVQQEGCNVIGTMVRTLAENGHDIGLFSSPSRGEGCEGDGKDGNDEDIASSTDWWAALGAVVSAMKMFSKSRPLQSNGTFALGCILKGSGETVNFGSACGSSLGKPALRTEDTMNGSSEVGDTARPTDFPGKDIVDNVEKISAAVEVTTAAMEEFSKVETVQVWGCAVLQQAFLAYVHYAKCLGPVSEACKLKSPLFSQSDQSLAKNAECGEAVRVPSPWDSLAKFILSQATLAMYMISRTMANSYSNSSTSQNNQTKSNPVSLQRGKNFCPRTQNSTLNIFFSSVRQSWCAALGAIGDVFGYLTRNSEVGKGFTSSECIDFFRSNKSLFDRSNFDQTVNMDTRSCCDSESEDAQSEKSSLDTEESEKRRSQSYSENNIKCATSSWIDWTGFGATQQQAVKDIKAWQEVTESMARIAEEVGFPLSVKNAILSIRTIFYKLDDAETVIWACHALVSLYLTWENLHLFKPEAEIDRDEYKSKIWGEGEAGVRQLVDLVVHWTNQNRLDVTSLALQALYGACVFAATIQEIDKVFSFGGCGPEAVLGAMQKALLSGNAQHRRKVVQPACCVLATVCGYSVRAQVNIAVHGGADLILTALDRYNEDNQVQINGLHALGIDSHAQPDFDAIWNSAISKTAPGKSARRRRGNQGSSSVVGLTHIFREGVSCSSFRDGLFMEESTSLLMGKWNTCFERLVLQGTAHFGLFRTALIAAPGCGGPPFAMEMLRRLGTVTNSTEMQAHVCFVMGCMSEHNAAWRTNLLKAGALQSVLLCMSSVCSWKHTEFTGFSVLRDGAEVKIPSEVEDSNNSMGTALCGVDSRIQCAAAWAIAGLVKDGLNLPCSTTNSIVQALVVALHRYGGVLSVLSPETHAKKPQTEVCAPARLALARLGVFRLATRSQVVHMVHEAAQTGDVMCLKALADAGIDLFVTDSDGKNGECYARLFNQSQAAQFFKEQVQKKKAREKAKAKNKQNSRKKVSEETTVIKEQDTVSQAVTEEALTSNEIEIVSAAPADSLTPTTESTTTETNTTDGSVTRDENEEDKKPKSRKSKKKSEKIEEVNEVPAVSKEQQLSIDQLNTYLREAMASGEVEKMEIALNGCEPDAHLVDERLLKQVKGALAKRLKRREKAGVLEVELTAAMEEASHSRLQAAILALEQAPRFAAALQEKLLAAKSQLLELETQLQKEQMQHAEQIESSTKYIEEELLQESDESWTVSHQKSRRKKEKENVDIPVQAPVDTPSTKTKNKTSRSRKQKSNMRQNDNPLDAEPNVNTLNNLQPQVQSFSESSWCRSPPAVGQDLPPLLPTPRSSLRSPVQPRSVIMPPKAAAVSCQHNPITPQLFPSTRSPLVSDLGDCTEHSQMSMPSTWSSPRSCSSLEDRPQSSSSSRWGAWPGSRSSTPENYGYEPGPAWSDSVTNPDSQGYVAALLSTLFPVERVPCSSTSSLFSASLGEFPAPSRLSSPSGLSTSHCAPGNDDSDILSFLDSTLRNGAYGLGEEENSVQQPHHVRDEADYRLFPHQVYHNLFGTTQRPDGGSLFSDHTIHRGTRLRSAEYSSDRNGKMMEQGSLFSGYTHIEQEQVGASIQARVMKSSGGSLFSDQTIDNNWDMDLFLDKSVNSAREGKQCKTVEVEKVNTEKVTKLGDCIQTSGGCTTGSVQTVNANCPSSWLQATLIEATLEDCCCICFDMPKDAALVPCGHRMCKNCAEQVRCLRESCPICNKYIDAVLVLYG